MQDFDGEGFCVNIALLIHFFFENGSGGILEVSVIFVKDKTLGFLLFSRKKGTQPVSY